MSKAILAMLIAMSFVSTAAFAEPSIEVETSSDSITALESVFVIGKITGVAEFKPVKITVTSPEGEVVYAPLVMIGDDGEFRNLIHPTIPSFMAGTYTVTASHEDTQITAQTQFTVTSEGLPRNTVIQPDQESEINEPKVGIISQITMSADTVNGSDIIKINGNTGIRNTDVALVVKSPAGNIVTIAQVTPDLQGNFQVKVKTGGPIWTEDGIYTITANQGSSSEYKESIQVEIEDGVVVPEFGLIASLILVVSVFAVIMVSSKSKLTVLSRY